jgi:hypothetical protein
MCRRCVRQKARALTLSQAASEVTREVEAGTVYAVSPNFDAESRHVGIAILTEPVSCIHEASQTFL